MLFTLVIHLYDLCCGVSVSQVSSSCLLHYEQLFIYLSLSFFF